MNEYERLFFDDVREKKITATGAKHRASRGKRAITVHHHADYLTAKQRKELSSPVITFKDYPLTLDELKKMNTEEQKSYLDFIITKYNASACKVGEMLGASQSYCWQFIDSLGIDQVKRRMSKEEKEVWKAFLDKRNQPEELVEPAELVEPVEEANEPTELEAGRTISFVIPKGCKCKVTIEVL